MNTKIAIGLLAVISGSSQALLNKPLSLTRVAYAQEATEAHALFKQLDVNEDGWLSGTELENGKWLKYDSNGDKEITAEEFAAGRAKEQGAAQPNPQVGTPISRKSYGNFQPLTQADVLYYIRSLGYDVVVKNINERGVNFKLTPAIEEQIKKFALPDTVADITTAVRNNYRVSGNSPAKQRMLARKIKPGRYAGGVVGAGTGSGRYEARPDLYILDAKRYKAGSSSGTYSYNSAGRTIRWVSGPLAGHKWSGEYIPDGYEFGAKDDRHIMDGDTITLYNEKHQILYSTKRANK